MNDLAIRRRPMLKAERDRKARIRKIRRENLKVIPRDGLWALRLSIDHQSFAVSERYGLTKREATWMSTQLAIALHRFKYGD